MSTPPPVAEIYPEETLEPFTYETSTRTTRRRTTRITTIPAREDDDDLDEGLCEILLTPADKLYDVLLRAKITIESFLESVGKKLGKCNRAFNKLDLLGTSCDTLSGQVLAAADTC
ncbi:unnamed protein product [Toxocara canis]|uniref:Biogenesis of lysosome-related organelles complex 1 subunit 3 n=1 Tax=Toxocara canis TaxID=6265 RepID=A0A183U4W0_TOXCA|nr:unnamed protein product [Toxocara canis]